MKKVEKIYNQIKDKLTQQENDIINAMFHIDSKYPNGYVDFEEEYKISHEETREIVRNLLKKFENQMEQMQYAAHIIIDKNIWIKPNDILEITIERRECEESENKSKTAMYNNEITYTHNGKQYLNFDYDIEEDSCTDVQNYVEEYIEQDLGITKYEIFDVQGDFFRETAKIRVNEIE